MPRLVDYADRFEGIRQAVYVITLREGADSITLPAVADELGISVSSVRRLLSSATHLPELGMQWIDRRARTRFSKGVPGELPNDDPHSVTVNPLLRELPCTPERADDARVWRALTLGFASTAWAQEARNSHQLFLATLVDRAIPSDLPSPDRDFESLRLHALVIGAIEGVCTDAISVDECLPLVCRHVQHVSSAWQAKLDSGAA